MTPPKKCFFVGHISARNVSKNDAHIIQMQNLLTKDGVSRELKINLGFAFRLSLHSPFSYIYILPYIRRAEPLTAETY